MNITNILKRNLGRIVTRCPHKLAGKAKGAPMTHYNCEVCQADAHMQIVGVWANKKPVQWVWLCDEHLNEIVTKGNKIMSETKFTPGPWYRGCSTKSGGIQIITVNPKTEEPNGLIATVNTNHTIEAGKQISDEVRANACLIAAAPEAFEAMDLFVRFLNSLPKGWLGKTAGDIGLLNDAYLMERKARIKAEGQEARQ